MSAYQGKMCGVCGWSGDRHPKVPNGRCVPCWMSGGSAVPMQDAEKAQEMQKLRTNKHITRRYTK